MFNVRTISSIALCFCLGCTAAAHAATLDDPMRPPGRAAYVGTKAAASAYTLTSTYITRQRKSAVINGKQVEEGGLVDGARVLEISPTQVRVRHRDQILTLRLLPLSVKKPALNE